MPRIAIVGAGPVGFEAALAAADRGDACMATASSGPETLRNPELLRIGSQQVDDIFRSLTEQGAR